MKPAVLATHPDATDVHAVEATPSPPPSAVFAPTEEARTRAKADKEHGMARHIGFISVKCVLNFHLPATSRTCIASDGQHAWDTSGIASSLVVPRMECGKDSMAGGLVSTKNDKKVDLAEAAADQVRNTRVP